MSVHSTHCCEIHGCVYRDPDCPVVAGIEKGIDCEDCESEFWTFHNLAVKLGYSYKKCSHKWKNKWLTEDLEGYICELCGLETYELPE